MIVLSSTSFVLPDALWSKPRHTLGTSLLLSCAVMTIPVVLLRDAVTANLESATNAQGLLAWLLWFPVAFIVLASADMEWRLSTALTTNLVCGGALIACAQLLSRPMVARDLFTRSAFIRSTPIFFALLTIVWSFSNLMHFSGTVTKDQVNLLFGAAMLDFIIESFAICSSPRVFMSTQYALILILVASQLSIGITLANFSL